MNAREVACATSSVVRRTDITTFPKSVVQWPMTAWVAQVDVDNLTSLKIAALAPFLTRIYFYGLGGDVPFVQDGLSFILVFILFHNIRYYYSYLLFLVYMEQ